MITTKKVAKWIWAEFWREMRIQKPNQAALAAMRHYEKVSIGRKAINGGNAAVKYFFLFVILAIIWSVIS